MSLEHDYDLEEIQVIQSGEDQFRMRVAPRLNAHDHSEREAHTARLLSKMCQRASIFIDVGAHHGFYSILAASRYPRLHVMALEPVRENFEILKQNVALNGLQNIQMHNLAVLDDESDASIRTSVLRRAGKTTSIDALMSSAEVGTVVFRIDAPGNELAVLDGMNQTLKRFPDLALFFRLDPCIIKAGKEPDGFLQRLDELGFTVFLIDDVNRRHFRIMAQTDWSVFFSAGERVSLVCLRKERAVSVLCISHDSTLAGAERSLLELVDELIGDYWTLATVSCPGEGPLVGELLEAGASVVISPYAWWCQGQGGQIAEDINRRIAKSFRLFEERVALLRAVGPDVIWTQSMVIPWGAMLATTLGKPHIWSVCEYGEKDHNLRFVLPFQDTLRAVELSSNFIFTNSPVLLRELFPELGPERGDFLYRHIQLPDGSQLKEGETFWSQERGFRVAVFGTLHEGKGQEDLIRALAILKGRGRDVELLVVGHAQPDYLAKLRSLTEELNISDQVTFTGFLKDPYPFMATADVIVSCARWEAFGRTVIEAMLLGRAVVYARTGGPSGYMTDGVTGLAYSPTDCESLADQIDRLILDVALRIKLGKTARSYARKTFSREGYGGKAYQKIMELRGQSPPIGSSVIVKQLLDLTLKAEEQAVMGTVSQPEYPPLIKAGLQSSFAEADPRQVELREEAAQLQVQAVQETLWELEYPPLIKAGLQSSLADANPRQVELREEAPQLRAQAVQETLSELEYLRLTKDGLQSSLADANHSQVELREEIAQLRATRYEWQARAESEAQARAELQRSEEELLKVIKEIESEADLFAAQLQCMAESTCWRLTAPLRILGQKVPGLARAIHAILGPYRRPEPIIRKTASPLMIGRARRSMMALVQEANTPPKPIGQETEPIEQKMESLSVFASWQSGVGRNLVLVYANAQAVFDRQSSGLRLYNIMRILNGLGYRLVLALEAEHHSSPHCREKYEAALYRIGVEAIAYGTIETERLLQRVGQELRWAFLSFPRSADRLIARVRCAAPWASIIYDMLNFHSSRVAQEVGLKSDSSLHEAADQMRVLELACAANADVTIVASYDERRELLELNPKLVVDVIPDIFELPDLAGAKLAERQGMLFVGGFQHKPNVDAVLWFVDEVWPLLLKQRTDLTFYVAGSDPPAEILALAERPGIDVTGYVLDATDLFDKSRLFVAPLRYRVGVKSNIGQSMAFGLPVVTTTVGAEGMGFDQYENLLIAGTAAEFAAAVLRLAEDDYLWLRLRENGRKFIEANQSIQIAGTKLQRLMNG